MPAEECSNNPIALMNGLTMSVTGAGHENPQSRQIRLEQVIQHIQTIRACDCCHRMIFEAEREFSDLTGPVCGLFFIESLPYLCFQSHTHPNALCADTDYMEELLSPKHAAKAKQQESCLDWIQCTLLHVMRGDLGVCLHRWKQQSLIVDRDFTNVEMCFVEDSYI